MTYLKEPFLLLYVSSPTEVDAVVIGITSSCEIRRFRRRYDVITKTALVSDDNFTDGCWPIKSQEFL